MALAALLSAVARTRRVPRTGWKVLTGKEKRDFNKGKRSMKAGYLDRLSNFRLVPSMLPQYTVPDLAGFKLKPYVAHSPRKEEASSSSSSGGSSSSSSGGSSSSSSGGGAP